MPKIYSQDRATAYWIKTGNKTKTTKKYEVNRNTVHHWITLYQEQGHTALKPSKPKKDTDL